jgi:hypothetical protein
MSSKVIDQDCQCITVDPQTTTNNLDCVDVCTTNGMTKNTLSTLTTVWLIFILLSGLLSFVASEGKFDFKLPGMGIMLFYLLPAIVVMLIQAYTPIVKSRGQRNEYFAYPLIMSIFVFFIHFGSLSKAYNETSRYSLIGWTGLMSIISLAAVGILIYCYSVPLQGEDCKCEEIIIT